MDGFLDERTPELKEPERDRVASRKKEIRREFPDAEDPEGAAEQALKESDARTTADPAPRDLGDDRVERRRSEDTTAPTD